MKYSDESPHIEASPPSHTGSMSLIATPINASIRLNANVAIMDCLNTARAPCMSPAPIRCATCTEKPVAAAPHKPENSHVLVDTSPMEADASAPRCPTMEASIYCITMEESWAITAGTLSSIARRSFCPVVIASPRRI